MCSSPLPVHPPDRLRLHVEIAGAVQGVGFRPFVYRLATELALAGWVLNDTHGVSIEVEGPAPILATFLQRLPNETPPNARILHWSHTWLVATGATQFEIRLSERSGAPSVSILPDLAPCPACQAELFDPNNRRFQYPFTNCTHCGPRFTILEALPYDRPNTTMQGFALCPACLTEYNNPLDRRFHAQPNACPVCGPELAFYSLPDVVQQPVPPAPWPAQVGSWQLKGQAQQAFDAAVAALRAGAVVAVKGLGGFQLMADARNAATVARLRARKERPFKPLAVMVRDLTQAEALCVVEPAAATLLASNAAPIVLLPRRPEALLAPEVAPGTPELGLMLPSTPLHHLLLEEVGCPLVATSGNLADEPICTDEWEALERLGAVADCFLLHNRPIARHADDSVLRLVEGVPQFLRRARGYAPFPLPAPAAQPTILATGAQLKNTVALGIGDQVMLSQHIGDLETAAAFNAFVRVIEDFLRLYAAEPAAVAHDLHPDYLSTQWARAAPLAAPRIAVQHHHAHLAACLADNGVVTPALGLIWDGTGYGPDGTIWGGECLLGDAASFTRFAHLRPFGLPGGEAAVREPRRVALALLWALYGEAGWSWDWLAPVREFSLPERRLLGTLLARQVNTPQTTSMGRLFDGVAALLGLVQRTTFEGEAAMALEHCADPTETGCYDLALLDAGRPAQLDWAPLVASICADLRRGAEQPRIAARFHNTVVEMGVAVAQAAGCAQVALSGGCFQNRRLTTQLASRLRARGFQVLLHRNTPPNDGGVSYGQVVVAAALLNRP